MRSRKVPREVGGFVVVPVSLPSSKAFPSAATHYIYLKTHDSQIPDADAPRSLFLVNIPCVTSEAQLRHLFATQLAAGRVEHVEFSEQSKRKAGQPELSQRRKRKRATTEEVEHELEEQDLPTVWDQALHATGATAVVVFVDRASRDASLKAARKAAKLGPELVWNGEGELGLRRYARYNKIRFPPRRELLHSVDAYMTSYGKLEEGRLREEGKKRSEPDADGFVTVTKGVKRSAIEDGDKIERKKPKSTGLQDFYRFQMREKRREEQGELLRRFEEDKKRLVEMRQRRGRLIPELSGAFVRVGSAAPVNPASDSNPDYVCASGMELLGVSDSKLTVQRYL